MKRITVYTHTLCIIGCMLCHMSCYDDKGNYEYHEINEIAVSGLEESYMIRVGEPITIKPVLEATLPGDEEDYSYEWIWMNAFYKNVYSNTRVWSSLKEWDDFAIGLSSGTYSFYYRVKDNKTGVTWTSEKFTITIENDIAEGFCVLSEVDNVGRLDFINLSKSGIFDLRLDILTKVGTEMPLLDKPLRIVCHADNNSPYMGASRVSGENFYMVAILTENGTYRLHPSTFLYEDKYYITGNILVDALLPNNFYAKDILSSSSYHALLDNNNNVYSCYPTFQMYWTANVYTNTTSDGRRINISPKADMINNGCMIMYDIDKKSFIKQTSSGATTSAYAPASSEKEHVYDLDTLLFKFNETEKDLVYLYCRTSLSGFTGYPIYTILKDPAMNQYFFGCFRETWEQQYYRELKNLPELSEAKEFAMTYNAVRQSYADQFFYYRTDKHIYVYDITGNEASVVYSAEGSNLISHISFVKNGTNIPNWRDCLLVCTYDPSKPADSCGTMQVMKTDPVYGTLSLLKYNEEKMEWTGFGKILNAVWKSK